MKNREELENQFEWWITCIPDKISSLKAILPQDLFLKLDMSIQSINLLETYLLDHYSLKKLQENKVHWDAFASYLGVVYKKNVPKSEWYIELDDVGNLFYNNPSLKLPNKLNFQPHFYISACLDRKSGNFISTTINKHLIILGSDGAA